MYGRMVIAEAVSNHQVQEFQPLYKELERDILKQPGIRTASLFIEDGGKMLVICTTWDNRENCLKYHSSNDYRQFLAKTQHLLLGQLVVKLLQVV